MELEIKILGPWQVVAGGEPLRLAGQRRIGVLARLAVSAGLPVTAQQLVTDVWAGTWAATADKQLHIVVSKLRELLAPHVGGEIIETVPGGYVLTLPRDNIDAHLFIRLVRRARTARAHGAAAAADSLFRQALALWRGTALAEVTAPWAQIESTRLEEERLAAFEDHVDLRLATGRHHAVVPDLVPHVEANPLRERPRAQLMLALYRAARPSEALEVYQEGRRVAVAELGIEPGAELRKLHGAVLSRDPVLDLATPAQETVLGEPVAPAELPADTRAFTARTEEVAWLRDVLARPAQGVPAVAAIDGPGGIGKSALAVHAAHAVADRFTDGVVYVNLHGATAGLPPLSSIEALRQLLRSLGLDGTAVPAEPDEAAARYRSLTAACNLLVILDNALDAAQVRPLIPAGADCAVVVTSRDVLGSLDNAHHLHLAGLTDAEAVTLLARIAGPARVQAEPGAAERIIRLCGGLPLAVRIAGARLASRPDWALADLAERLADATRRLDTLQYADLAVRAGIAVSHQHLREEPAGQDAARVLTMLGLLDTPTHTPAATAALTGWPEHRAEAALDRLRNARLLESAGPSRYRLHDLIRLYTREQAARELPEPDRAAAVHRALHHYLATATTAGSCLHPASQVLLGRKADQPGVALTSAEEASRWVGEERDNLLAVAQQALDGPDPQTAVALAIRLHWPFCYQGWHTQLIGIYKAAIEAAGRCADRAGKAQIRSFLGWVHRDQGRYDDAISELERALAAWDRAGLPRRKIGALNTLGVTNTLVGRLDAALSHLGLALTFAEGSEQLGAEATIRNNRVHVYYRQGRMDEAVAEARAVVDLFSRERVSLMGEGTARDTLGDAYRHAGRLTEAVESYELAVKMLRESGYRLGEAVSRWWLGTTLHDLGRHDEARKAWRESLMLLRDARLLTPAEADDIDGQAVPETPRPIMNML
ncbi:DNA-binding SARP family transcriptional activator [Nonomuraea polychroma]|uniref:DNA-binding SARP family transcriptional activator n=1 Tax=Nonomuraea polychroma TaxID=46176 RepID=A0A438M3J2_9ACTN|nr:BTAD domain-containing putative transcriptional regulator [Nonomuraea polychroma]RVX40023.1 DNA-binding SARP family transcriptional activator [Nonomuraea polychroma]